MVEAPSNGRVPLRDPFLLSRALLILGLLSTGLLGLSEILRSNAAGLGYIPEDVSVGGGHRLLLIGIALLSLAGVAQFVRDQRALLHREDREGTDLLADAERIRLRESLDTLVIRTGGFGVGLVAIYILLLSTYKSAALSGDWQSMVLAVPTHVAIGYSLLLGLLLAATSLVGLRTLSVLARVAQGLFSGLGSAAPFICRSTLVDERFLRQLFGCTWTSRGPPVRVLV